jgi:plasmid stabilization system protein ParE
MAAAATTAEYTYLHGQGRVAGTRELVAHPNYIVVRQVEDCVEVLNAFHARLQYPAR